jgi:hypothetical protein
MDAGLDNFGIYWTELDYIYTGEYSKTVLVECKYYQNMSDQVQDVFSDISKSEN